MPHMMDFPLLLSSLYDRAVKVHPERRIVSVNSDKSRHYTTYGETDPRVRRLATALRTLGIDQGDVIGTFAWNNHRHHELYWATANTGVVCHTLNIRLFPEQLSYVINHAGDKVLFVDPDLAPLLAPVVDSLDTVETFVVLGDPAETSLPNAVGYEDLIADADEWTAWPALDERSPMMFVYTSGTTGNPKGVAYTQRSTYVHTMSTLAMNPITPTDNVLAIVPMFHAAAWGLPFNTLTGGGELTYPGPDLSPAAIAALIAEERVTMTAGVPTVFLGLQHHLMENPDVDVTSLQTILCGGSAVPRALNEWYWDNLGVPIKQAWGMTETNPIASVATLKPRHLDLTKEEQLDLLETVGVPVPGLEVKIVDDEFNELPHDSEAFGELLIRGPWIAAEYYNDPRTPQSFHDGWLRTGDVCTISPEGYIKITDRAKDVIKSGGEWISSLDLENTIMAHPDVAEATVVGVKHQKWQERPVAFVVPRPGAEVTEDAVLSHLDGKVASWWMPDRVVFIDAIPKTGTGKFDKKVIRDEYADVLMEG